MTILYEHKVKYGFCFWFHVHLYYHFFFILNTYCVIKMRLPGYQIVAMFRKNSSRFGLNYVGHLQRSYWLIVLLAADDQSLCGLPIYRFMQDLGS